MSMGRAPLHHAWHQLLWMVPPVAIALAAAAFPTDALLPALSLLSLAGACVAVLLSGGAGRAKLRDVAGLLAFLGFSAALLSDAADTLPLFDQRRR